MTTATKPSIQLSGLYYPNRMARLLFTSLEEIMGKNGINALLRLNGLEQFIDNYPNDTLERQFDFAYFTAMHMALEDMYGVRGGRGLALRAGRVCFSQGLKGFGALAGAGDLAFKVLPLPMKLKVGLPALATLFTNFSDQVTELVEQADHYVYIMKKCPCCYNRKTDKPVCYTGAGVLQEGLRWVSGGHEFRVMQTKCHAMGDEFCEYTIWKDPVPVQK
jgi:predicted hydrocarbon binding protein